MKRRRGKEQKCFWDWMLHQGNVHYACNSSAFTTYTKLTSSHSERLGLGAYGAVGIGTVSLAAPRGYGAPDVCTIRLYDVLHIPSMPCDGISIPRLTWAGTEVLEGRWRTVVTHGPAGALLFEAKGMLGDARRMLLEDRHRLCLVDQPEILSTAEEPDMDLPFSVGLVTDEKDMVRLGTPSREFHGEEYEIRVVSGEWHGVGC